MRTLKKICSFIIIVVMALMVNSSDVYAAGSFSVSGGGTVSAGGTKTITITASDCAGMFSISASGSGKVSSSSVWLDCSSSSVTVTAPSSGSTTITVTASDVTDYDGNTVSGSKTATVTVQTSSSSSSGSSSGSSTTTTTPTVTKSSDNKLTALSISEGTLSPEFESSVTVYTASVLDVDTITIEATKSDSEASVSGTGEKELEPGKNTFDIVVTAENGSTKTYSITVTMEESPTVYITYGDTELGVVKNVESIAGPDGFEETTLTINGEEIAAWKSNLLGMTVIYMVDGDGETGFYLYDEEAGVMKDFSPLGLLGRNVYVVEISEEEQTRSGMVYGTVTVDGNEMMGWTFEDESLSDYLVIYVMSETGEMVSYLYCVSDNAMILAPNMAPVSSETYQAMVTNNSTLTTEVENVTIQADNAYFYLQVAFVALAALLLLILLLLILYLKSRKKYKKVLAKVEQLEEQDIMIFDTLESIDEELNEDLSIGEEELQALEAEYPEESYKEYNDYDESYEFSDEQTILAAEEFPDKTESEEKLEAIEEQLEEETIDIAKLREKYELFDVE